MNWRIPDWYALILLSLASYRTWRLLAEDTILEPIRSKVAPAESKRSEFLACSACFGFWVGAVWWLAWVAWSKWSLVIAALFAISALVILAASVFERD